MFTAGWIAIILEILLLLIWVYDIFFARNGTDPAGKGLAMVFLLGLIVYIVAGITLLMTHRKWAAILVVVMAAIPLGLVIAGLWKQYGPGHR